MPIDDLPRRDEPIGPPPIGASASPAAPTAHATKSAQRRSVAPTVEAAQAPETAGGPTPPETRLAHDLAGTLRALIDDAGNAATRLDRAMRDATRAADIPDATARQMQERLRLGASMMQALQAQLDESGAAIEEFGDLEQAAANAMIRLDERAEAIGADLEGRARAAGGGVVHVEQLVRAMNARMDVVEQRVLEAVQRAETACATALESAATVTRSAGEAREIARQCQEARGELGGALLAGAARIDELTARGETILQGIEERLDQAEVAADRVSSAAGAINAASGRVDAVVSLCARLDTLLERLAPWERMLADGEVDATGLPRRAGQMVEALRTGIGEDMAQLSETMRELAERVDGLGLPRADKPGRSLKLQA